MGTDRPHPYRQGSTMIIRLIKLWCVLALWVAHGAWAAVEVNKADKSALESIKGIGPSVSVRILDERKKSTFKDWPDLVRRVKGVGEGSAARYSKEGLTVNGAGFTPSAKGVRREQKGRLTRLAPAADETR